MEILSQEKLKVIFDGLKNYWSNVEIEDENSIFYKKKIIEKEFKKLCPKSRGVTLSILKAIKLSFMKGGRCYYTQRELAKQFKVSQSTVKQSMKLIEKICKTKFLKLPKSIVNYKLSNKSYFRQMLIPPSLHKKLSVDGDFKLSVEKGMLSVERGGVECICSGILNDSIKLGAIPISLYHNLYGIIYSYLNPSDLNEEKNNTKCFLQKHQELTFFSKDKPMKQNLQVKEKHTLVVTYETFGINPKKFMSHIELHRTLSKWLDILIDKNIIPKFEQTKMFLSSWNNIDNNKRFTKHRVNTKSFTFKLICLALTYRMWIEGVTIEEVEKSIENFSLIASKQGKLLHVKKLDCLNHFLCNSRSYGQKDYFKLSLLDEKIVLTEYYNKSIPPERAFERVRKLFGSIFYSDRPQVGKEVFKSNYKRFIDFTNIMVDNHMKKEMEGFEPEDEEEIIDAFHRYVEAYFSYVYRTIEKSNSLYVWTPYFILGQHGEFVGWLSHQKGWRNFMKDRKIEEKPQRFKLEIKKILDK